PVPSTLSAPHLCDKISRCQVVTRAMCTRGKDAHQNGAVVSFQSSVPPTKITSADLGISDGVIPF
ncbi:MAG: hypothetical protein ACYTXY_05885, partial [Nostoc sp.]